MWDEFIKGLSIQPQLLRILKTKVITLPAWGATCEITRMGSSPGPASSSFPLWIICSGHPQDLPLPASPSESFVLVIPRTCLFHLPPLNHLFWWSWVHPDAHAVLVYLHLILKTVAGTHPSEVINVSPGNLDSSLCFIQPNISHDVSAYKLNKYLYLYIY